MKNLALIFALCISSTFASENWVYSESAFGPKIISLSDTSEIKGILLGNSGLSITFHGDFGTPRYVNFRDIKKDLERYSAQTPYLTMWVALTRDISHHTLTTRRNV